LETADRFGKKVTAELPVQVLDTAAGKLAIKIPNLVAAQKWSLEPGEEFLAVWGSGYDSARAFVEIEHRKKLLQSFWTEKGATQLAVKQKIEEAMRGGFTLRVTMVRENRAYLESRHVDVPWSNKNLTVKWEHFVSKLQPAQKETWTAVVSGPDAKKTVAEFVAALYDASLDAYQSHSWPGGFGLFRQDHSHVYAQFENMLKHLQAIHYGWKIDQKDATLTYRHFPFDIIGNFYGYEFARGGRMLSAAAAPAAALRKADRAVDGLAAEGELARGANAVSDKGKQVAEAGAEAPEPDLSKVSARKNLNETAFFFPHLIADKDGTVRMEFTMPEALTEWKFLGFAHDADMRAGLLTDKVVTSKELMIQPNAPRFVREGDKIEFTVKVSNQSAGRQTGKVRLGLADALSLKSVDELLGNAIGDQTFDIPAGESKSFSWKLSIPDDLGFLTYKAVGSSGRLSDGEEGYLPVLARRVLVTESLPLPLRGAGIKEFDFKRLRDSAKSDSLRNKSLTVQMVSNPSWYAVMALPYLMEYPYECTEQTFNRLYANALARHIAASDPKIRRVFDVWKTAGGDTLDSPLEKNQDLKAVMIEETPWVRQAAAESQARRNVGILFDDNRLNTETERLLRKLADQQYADGRWPWFPGGPANDYITLYITTGFGRMRHLGVTADVAPAIKSLARLDAWVTEIYQHIPADRRDKNNLSTLIAFYLYGRSFFLQDQAVADANKEAVNYWLGQAKKHWLELAVRQSQGHLAVALKRFGDLNTAKGIMASIKERSVSDEEMGMFWRDLELSWWWFRAPIETQAMMIEAFDEVMGDKQAVEDCKVWLLKQKQTQDWKTTKATADAVYALLLRGTNLLASDALVEVSVGGQKIEPEKTEAGTGFYEERFAGSEIKPDFGKIMTKKADEGVAWGSVHWQYLEDMSKVTGYEGTPLKLTKQLYTKQHSKKGPVLEPVKGPVAVGDELVVRVTLRTDRDMEYVHLKDYRGSGTEPVNVLSQYKFQDGLAYYESTRDTASHFFIDYLPKGVYVFEYSVRVQLKGQYQTGFASIQCMYAPEFNSHSESLVVTVE
ncbi:MAG: alpha-2-macroglobulin family protein, partial [Deltaproteobacteria bacterium]